MIGKAFSSAVTAGRRGVRPAVLLALCGILGSQAAIATGEPPRSPGLDFIAGTWTGRSACVADRPACKNETVVYRFVPLDGHPRQARLLADKIIEGKRVPMGSLVFDVDEQHHSLRCEFTVGRTHGIWSYAVTGDSMTGRLVVLPEGVTGRDVTARRVNEGDVPPAPPLGAYEE